MLFDFLIIKYFDSDLSSYLLVQRFRTFKFALKLYTLVLFLNRSKIIVEYSL